MLYLLDLSVFGFHESLDLFEPSNDVSTKLLVPWVGGDSGEFFVEDDLQFSNLYVCVYLFV